MEIYENCQIFLFESFEEIIRLFILLLPYTFYLYQREEFDFAKKLPSLGTEARLLKSLTFL